MTVFEELLSGKLFLTEMFPLMKISFGIATCRIF